MTTAIATAIQAILNDKTELIELDRADIYWQTQIGKAIAQTDRPIYLVFPQTTATLAAIMKLAAQKQWCSVICGRGTKLGWGKLTKDIQLVISTQKCDRLIEHAVGDLTVTVEAGMKLQDLQAILRSHNQFLPVNPSYPDKATLGGIVATADTGSWREGYGGVRDLLLGLSFVRADGAIAKAGGRVVKNVAGYDLMKLFTGAYGTLGIISQLTFRTYPSISSSQTLLLTGEARAIAQTVQTIRNSGLTPTAMDLLSTEAILRLDLGERIGLMVRWQTIPESIAQQVAQVKAIATQLDLTSRDYQEDAELALWQECAQLFTVGNSNDRVTCKIGIAPNAAVDFLRSPLVIDNRVVARIHASKGIGQLQFNNLDSQAIAAIRTYCQQNFGFLTILDAPAKIKEDIDVWGYQGNAIKTMKAIKYQFDPQNILNRDRFIV